MADLLPHYKSRVPGYWVEPRGHVLAHDAVPHPFSGNFPTGYDPSDGDTQVLDPLGGVAGPILAATEMTTATAGVAPAAGLWEPGNAVVPQDLATLVSVAPTAVPAVAIWTIGQYMILGDGSFAHWNGTDWVAGKSPGA